MHEICQNKLAASPHVRRDGVGQGAFVRSGTTSPRPGGAAGGGVEACGTPAAARVTSGGSRMRVWQRARRQGICAPDIPRMHVLTAVPALDTLPA